MSRGKLPARTPVLVGWATVSQREDDPLRAREPLALMIDACRKAGSSSLLRAVERIYVPRGRWRYRNPGGAIARTIGADNATSVLAHVGVLQQTLFGDACQRIRDGDISTAMIVGGDAGYRLQRARIAGIRADDSQQSDDPDDIWSPEEDLLHPAELRAGLGAAVGLYALLHSAFTAGGDSEDHRQRIAGLMSRLSQIAADNPQAWTRQALTAQDILEPGPKNAMQAFPYTRLHCANWSVDQAACLILCSAERAVELGVDPDRWIFPVASSESNHMVPVSARPRLDQCTGARLAGEAALAAAGIASSDLDFVELYSCFPIALESYAQALGLPLDRPLSVTGGMAMAGGPFNNYVLQATCRMADLLIASGAERPRSGLVSSVSGILTKQGFGIWSNQTLAPFAAIDVSAEVAAAEPPVPVAMDYDGSARVLACTTLHDKGQRTSAVVIAETLDRRRIVASSTDEAIMTLIERGELPGTPITVSGGCQFSTAS